MAELYKMNVNGELYDMSDSKARSDIASEITNRTNADDALQEKINTNKTGIDNLVNDVAVRNVKAEEVTNVPEVKLPLDEVKEEIEAAGNRVLNSIPDDYTQMNNKISELKGDLVDITDNEACKLTKGYYIDLSKETTSYSHVSNDSYYNAVVDCVEGDKFTIKGAGGIAPRLWGFIDINGNIISKSGISSILDDEIIIAPEGAIKLVVNTTYGYLIKGEKISSIVEENKKDLSSLKGEFLIKTNIAQFIKFYRGYVLKPSGIVTEGDNAMCTDFIMPSEDGEIIINVPDGMKWCGAVYDSSKNVIAASNNWNTISGLSTTVQSNRYYRFSFAHTDGSDVYINDVRKCEILYRANYHERYSYLETKLLSSSIVTISAHDSTDIDKAKADYICTGVNDEKVISHAINSLTKGGTVLLFNGTYQIDDYSVIDDDIKACIYVKNTGYDRKVVITGDTSNNWYTSNYGCVIHVNSSKFNDSDTYSVISGDSYKPSDELHTWCAGVNGIEIKNLMIKIEDYSSNVIGIDCRKFGSAIIEYVIIENDHSNEERYGTGYPSTPKEGMIGVYSLPGAQTMFKLTNVIVNSFYTGFYINGGEHCVMIACAACRCVYGYIFENIAKTVMCLECMDEGNTFLPKFIRHGSIFMQNFCIENLGKYPIVEGVTERYAVESPQGSWNGTIRYKIAGNAFGTKGNSFFSGFGGKNIDVRKIDAPMFSPTNPTDKDLWQTYFNTTISLYVTWTGIKWIDSNGNEVIDNE